MKTLRLIATGALAVLLFAVNAQAILIDRGNGLIFDSTNNISWTKDADISGQAIWSNQVAFANNLTLAGFDDFRLPSIAELGSLYGQLPGAAGSNKTGDNSPFEDIQSFFWSSAEVNADDALYFRFDFGVPLQDTKQEAFYGWAVRAGDSLAAVPEPASILLLGAGLSALLGVRRLGYL